LIEQCEVVGICDPRPERRTAAQRLFRDVPTFEDPATLLDPAHVDALVIATPVASHTALAAPALQRGLHVLCEKPLASTAAECRVLCDIADQAGRILMVGHVFLYNPGLLHVKADLDRGHFGRVFYIDAVRTNLGPVRTDVGAIHDLGCHDISMFNFLLGAKPLTVSAEGGRFLSQDREDVGFLSLRYPGNVLCHLHTSWLNPRKVRQLTLVGERRMAVWDDMNTFEPVRYYDRGFTPKDYSSFGEFHLVLRDGDIAVPKVEPREPIAAQAAGFIQAIRTGQPPLADGRSAIDVVEVLEAAQRSMAAQGQAVAIGPVVTP
jgi:predicted dehydrogenase